MKFKSALAIIGIVALSLVVTFNQPVMAQDSTPNEPVKRLSKVIPGPAVLKAELMNKFSRETGAFTGDFNITVFPTAKAANGFKYNGIKHFMFIGSDTIAFYSGEEGKGNKPVIIITSGFTIETR